MLKINFSHQRNTTKWSGLLNLVIWLLTLRAVQKAGLDGLCIMNFELGCGFDLGKYDETVIDVGTTVNF